jgi:hypothetical protein
VVSSGLVKVESHTTECAKIEQLVVVQFELERWSGAVVDAACAVRRRSRCGAFRSWPVLSSHFSPGFAPQVGQRIPNIGLTFLFMSPHYAKLRGENTVHFCSTENFNLGAQRIASLKAPVTRRHWWRLARKELVLMKTKTNLKPVPRRVPRRSKGARIVRRRETANSR